MPVKYQPDLIYLRHVKTRRVHLFTLIQTVCFALIMVVKEITITSLAFPITVCARNSHVITVISNVPSVLSAALALLAGRQEEHPACKN